MEIIGHYQYILDVLDNHDIINDYRIDGGRWGAKTGSVIPMLSILANNNDNIVVVGIRYREVEAKDGAGMEQEFIDRLKDLKVNYKHTSSKGLIELDNGSKIFVRGAVGIDGQPKFSGKNFGNVKAIIVFTDEAFDFDKRQWDAIREGIRGNNNPKMIYIRANNNWDGVNWYTKELNSMLPFNLEKLRTEGEQYKIVGKTLVHHTNVVLNTFMEGSTILDLAIEDAVKDPERAKVSLWGIPGALNGSVFNDYSKVYNRQKENILDNDKYSIGISLTDRRRVLGSVLSGIKYSDKSLSILEEYNYSQEKDYVFKNVDEMIDELVENIKVWNNKYKLQHKGFTINFTDSDTYKNVASIRRVLQSKLYEIGINNWTMIIGETKYSQKEMIDSIHSLLATNRVYSNIKSITRTLAELDSAAYNENGDKLNEKGIWEQIFSLWNSIIPSVHSLKQP